MERNLWKKNMLWRTNPPKWSLELEVTVLLYKIIWSGEILIVETRTWNSKIEFSARKWYIENEQLFFGLNKRNILDFLCVFGPRKGFRIIFQGQVLSLRNLSTQMSAVGAIGWTIWLDSPGNRKKWPENDDFHKEFMSTKSCYLQATCSFSVNKNWPDWFVADFCLWYDTPLWVSCWILILPGRAGENIMPSCHLHVWMFYVVTTTFTKFSAVRGSRQIKTNNLFICAEARRLLYTSTEIVPIPSWRIETSTKIPKNEWQVTALMILLALVTKVLWSHCQRGCRFLGSRWSWHSCYKWMNLNCCKPPLNRSWICLISHSFWVLWSKNLPKKCLSHRKVIGLPSLKLTVHPWK